MPCARAAAAPGRRPEGRARTAGRLDAVAVGTSAAGIREALAVGTGNAIRRLSQVDGYLGNEAVRILLPSSIQKVSEVARIAGYVTRRSLDGLFHVVGEEERRIRTNPAARTTELLRSVFGR